MLTQYLVVLTNDRKQGHVQRLPFKKGKPDIVTEGLTLTAGQAQAIAVLLHEAQDIGWNAACDSMVNYCKRVEVLHVRRRQEGG